ncbi:FAD binding domain-containing protein [Aspergillus pseudoustus]|uniref:FAD binding domain-containing protein n=1 Tax=Aspergillus pseudoustus TaxID=1810923 RepID=A0ABR4L1Y9_9EURO
MELLDVDVLVCGGGMSGLACANFASQAGCKVLLVEKQSHLGGSSNYSAGMFWAPKDIESLRAWIPNGDPVLQRFFLEDFLPCVEWLRQNGVPVSSRFDGMMTIGRGFPISIPFLHDLHQRRIKEAGTGSDIFLDTAIVKLIQKNPGVSGSRVTGAVIRRNLAGSEAKYYQVTAKAVVLATGGFQGSHDLVSTYLGPGMDNIFVRSNRGSAGDGNKLGRSVGAALSRGLSTYYGHLMAAPLRQEDVDPKDFLPLAQYQSKHCLLINEEGRRFVDETLGDEIVNQHLAKQSNRRGFLLFTENTKKEHCVSAPFPRAGNVDRLEKARDYGCNVAGSATMDGLIDILVKWGVNGQQARSTLSKYNAVIADGDKEVLLDAPVGRLGSPPEPLTPDLGPFYVMEVQPSITFPYGGIAINRHGQALSADGTVIPGLFVAGVDAGGLSNLGYAGGLAVAFITGLWVSRSVAKQLSFSPPRLPRADANDVQADASLGEYI